MVYKKLALSIVFLQITAIYNLAMASTVDICTTELVYENNKGGKHSFGEIIIPPSGRSYSVWFPVVPGSIAVDSDGNVFVADTVNYRILSISKNGKLVKEIKLQPPVQKRPELAYYFPSIEIDDTFIYIVNAKEYRIEIYRKKNGKHFNNIDYKSEFRLPKFIRVIERKIFVSGAASKNLIYNLQGHVISRNNFPHIYSKSFINNENRDNLLPYGKKYIAARGYDGVVVEDVKGRTLAKCKIRDIKFQLLSTGPIYYSRNSKELHVLEENTLNIYRVRMVAGVPTD